MVDVVYLRKWLVIGVLVGIAAGVSSILLRLGVDWATRLFLGLGAGYSPPLPGGEGASVFTGIGRLWMIPVLTTAGGLIAGVLTHKFGPECAGGGTDHALSAFHNREGEIRRRVPLIEIIASAFIVGSGGSAGPEGPIMLIGASWGSTIANMFHLRAADRRTALAMGIGAGMGALFKAPLGGAILGAEILYHSDFEVSALLPSFVASIIGYAIFASWQGWTPMFSFTTAPSFSKPEELAGYLLLGVACGLLGALYSRSFYGIRNLFRALPFPSYLKPALGGLMVGAMGMFLPQVLGEGYGWAQFAISGNFVVLPLLLIVGMLFGKIVATGLSVGSGGAGGVFAPGLVIGGMVGAALWALLHRFSGIVPADPGAFVVVGMMTFFGGVSKAPLAIMMMVSEMTGSYALLVPSMVSVIPAYFLTGNNYIYESQVNTRADSPAHRAEYSVPLMEKIDIRDAMVTNPVTVSPEVSLSSLAILMKSKEIDAAPVVDSGRLVGMITSRDMARISENKWAEKTVREIMSKRLVVGYPDETLHQALLRVTRHRISHLAVVERAHPDKLIGFLAIHDIASVYDATEKTISEDGMD